MASEGVMKDDPGETWDETGYTEKLVIMMILALMIVFLLRQCWDFGKGVGKANDDEDDDEDSSDEDEPDKDD